VATATTVPAAHLGTIFVASGRNLQKRVAVTAQQISRRHSNLRSVAGIAKRANHYSVSQNVYMDGISIPQMPMESSRIFCVTQLNLQGFQRFNICRQTCLCSSRYIRWFPQHQGGFFNEIMAGDPEGVDLGLFKAICDFLPHRNYSPGFAKVQTPNGKGPPLIKVLSQILKNTGF